MFNINGHNLIYPVKRSFLMIDYDND